MTLGMALAFVAGGALIGFGIRQAIAEHSHSRDPIADALLAKYRRESAILKEVRRVCGVKD